MLILILTSAFLLSAFPVQSLYVSELIVRPPPRSSLKTKPPRVPRRTGTKSSVYDDDVQRARDSITPSERTLSDFAFVRRSLRDGNGRSRGNAETLEFNRRILEISREILRVVNSDAVAIESPYVSLLDTSRI